MVCPRMDFVLAAEKNVPPHIVEAILLELIHFKQGWIHFSGVVGAARIDCTKTSVWVEIEVPGQYAEQQGKDAVGEKNVSFVEVVHVSCRRCLLEENGKARREHRAES